MSQTDTQDGEEQPERKLKFKIPAERFRQFLDPINALVDEAKLEFDNEGIRVAATDPANVAMVEAELYHTAFAEYEAADGVIGINTRSWGELLDTAPEDAAVRFELVKFKKYTITIGRFEWTEGWIDPDHVRRGADLPDLDLPAEIVVPSEELARMIDYTRFVDRVGHTRLAVDADRREFTASIEGETDDGEYRFAMEDGVVIRRNGDADSGYSNDYLKDCIDGIPGGVDVTLELGEEFPFRMQFGIDEGQVELMQAPRIVSD